MAPAGPAGPTGPVAPCGPVGPTGPVNPIGPAGPGDPAGPAAPVSPRGPPGPTGPVGPIAPAGPLGPLGPAGPVSPRGPIGPTSPPLTESQSMVPLGCTWGTLIVCGGAVGVTYSPVAAALARRPTLPPVAPPSRMPSPGHAGTSQPPSQSTVQAGRNPAMMPPVLLSQSLPNKKRPSNGSELGCAVGYPGTGLAPSGNAGMKGDVRSAACAPSAAVASGVGFQLTNFGSCGVVIEDAPAGLI